MKTILSRCQKCNQPLSVELEEDAPEALVHMAKLLTCAKCAGQGQPPAAKPARPVYRLPYSDS